MATTPRKPSSIAAIALVASLAPVPARAGTSVSDRIQRILSSERVPLSRAFETDAKLILFDDGNIPNAMAFGRETSLGFWGVIYLGTSLLTSDFQDPSKGPDALIGIMAHEFAHVLQDRRKSALAGVTRELHADFMAGWYWARRRPGRPRLRALARVLADRAGGAEHGTSGQRVRALFAGAGCKSELNEAFRKGERFAVALVGGEAIVVDPRAP